MKRKLLSLLLATVMLLGCVLPVFATEAEATGESEELSVVMETIEIQIRYRIWYKYADERR